jgi:hypothetical protein
MCDRHSLWQSVWLGYRGGTSLSGIQSSDQPGAEAWAMSRAGSEKNTSNDAGAITFSGTLSGTLVGARSGAGAGGGVWAGFGTVSGMSIGVEPG